MVGYSAGAIVALHVAVQRPDLVQRLVLISGAFHPDGMLVKPVFDGPSTHAAALGIRGGLTRRPEYFPVVLAKVAQAAQDLGGLGSQDLHAVTCRVLVVAADDDIVYPSSTPSSCTRRYRTPLSPSSRNASLLLLREHLDELTRMVGRVPR